MDNERIWNLDEAKQPIFLWNCQRALLQFWWGRVEAKDSEALASR